jgi:putative molybdopterin biosynthesis protein
VNTTVTNQVAEIRKSRGIGASDLARRVNVSRQTIYAIEAGSYVPNTEVALHLARELEVSIDELFMLGEEREKAPKSLAAEVLSGSLVEKGQPVRVCQVGARWISVPVSASPYYMPEADGVIKAAARAGRRAELVVFAKDDASAKRLVLAGCDPAANLLAHMVEKVSGIEVIPAAASSKLALTWLKEGKVHIAGSHLEDPRTGEFNLPYLRKEFPDKDFNVITFAHWEEGLVVASGNPKRLHKVEDLARKTIRLINREPGSGSRALLDRSFWQRPASIAASSWVMTGRHEAIWPQRTALCREMRTSASPHDPLLRPSAWTSFRFIASVTILCFVRRWPDFPQSKRSLMFCSAQISAGNSKHSPDMTHGKQARSLPKNKSLSF